MAPLLDGQSEAGSTELTVAARSATTRPASRRQAHLLEKSDEPRLARNRCEPGIHFDPAQVDGADLERTFQAAESSVPVAQPHLDERDPKRRDVLGVSALFELSKDHQRFVGPPRNAKRMTERAVGADRVEI